MKNNDALQTKTPSDLKNIVAALQNTLIERERQIKNNETKINCQLIEINLLREKLHLALHARFGKKSEKTPHDIQGDLFDEAHMPENLELVEATEAEIAVPSYTRKKRGRKPLPDYLPRIQQFYDLRDDEKICDCGCALTHIGNETAEQLEFIPAKVQVIQHVRLIWCALQVSIKLKSTALA